MHRNVKHIIILTACGVCFLSLGYCADKKGDDFQYEAKGKRDPFFPLVGQEKVLNPNLESVASIDEVVLGGIAVGVGGRNVAILNGQMVRENDRFGVLCIKKISQETVEISIDGKGYTLNIQEEGEKVGKQ